MQTRSKAVRYYIDRGANTPVIRAVPVSRSVADAPAETATAFAASESRRRATRHRLTSMIQASVRKHRHNAS